MQASNVFEIKMGNMGGIHGLFASYKMKHLEKFVKIECKPHGVQGKPKTRYMLTLSHGP